MTIKPARVFSDWPIPPGEVLAEEIAARGISLPELAARIGRPLWVVDEIVRGEQAIDRDTAIALSAAVGGIDADFWTGWKRATGWRWRGNGSKVPCIAKPSG